MLHTHKHTQYMQSQGTTSCLGMVAVTVTVVCVSFSYYAAGMIPIRSDRGSHCKHHVSETGREMRQIVFKREGRASEIGKKKLPIWEKWRKKKAVRLLECVHNNSWGSAIEQLSSTASMSWLQTSLVAPRLNYTPVSCSLCLPCHTCSPFFTCFLLSRIGWIGIYVCVCVLL